MQAEALTVCASSHRLRLSTRGNTEMLTVYFTNHGYASDHRFKSLEDAIAYARRVHFQAQIHNEAGLLVATWCPIAGTRTPFGHARHL
jgi:hypothetical protein